MAAKGRANLAGRAIKLISGAIDLTVLAAILALAAVGFYAMWDSKQVFGAADPSRYEIYKPSADGSGLSFEELREINPEVFGWLTVYGTNIDYPVVQGETNMKYVNMNAEGDYSLSGAIFLDARSDDSLADFSSILYGHHMEKQAMFGEIGLFADEGYFGAREHGTLYANGETHGLDFIMFVSADAYDGTVFRTRIEGDEDRMAYVDRLRELALLEREAEVSPEDRIVLLSTCSSSATNGRDILVAKLSGEVCEDPFEAEEEERSFGALAAGAAMEALGAMPPWGAAAAAAAAIAPTAMMLRKKRLKRRNERERARAENG